MDALPLREVLRMARDAETGRPAAFCWRLPLQSVALTCWGQSPGAGWNFMFLSIKPEGAELNSQGWEGNTR